MKIKHYPGKAVDASLSLEGSSAMGALYEANWLRAANQPAAPATTGTKLSRQSSSAGSSFLIEGISALSKYQMTLENIRQLELQSRDKRIASTIKELSGYRPSALQHHQQQQMHNVWVAEDQDQEHEELEDASEGKEKLASIQEPPAVNHYVLDPTERPRVPRPRQQFSVKPPSLRRSQTMSQPPSYATLRSPRKSRKISAKFLRLLHILLGCRGFPGSCSDLPTATETDGSATQRTASGATQKGIETPEQIANFGSAVRHG